MVLNVKAGVVFNCENHVFLCLCRMLADVFSIEAHRCSMKNAVVVWLKTEFAA